MDDKKTGKGTMFYANGDRYDGMWLDDKPHDEGRMIFSNGDVYEGIRATRFKAQANCG